MRERLSELATTEIGFDPILSPGKKTEDKEGPWLQEAFSQVVHT